MQKLLSIDEVSAILGVTKATIYSWTSRNMIPHIKLSKKLLKFREDDLIAWIEKKSVYAELQISQGLRKRHKRSKKIPPHHEGWIEEMVKNAKREILQ